MCGVTARRPITIMANQNRIVQLSIDDSPCDSVCFVDFTFKFELAVPLLAQTTKERPTYIGFPNVHFRPEIIEGIAILRNAKFCMMILNKPKRLAFNSTARLVAFVTECCLLAAPAMAIAVRDFLRRGEQVKGKLRRIHRKLVPFYE